MGNKEYCAVTGVLFLLVALAHLARIILDMPVRVDGFDVPMLTSWAGLVVPAGLSTWAFWLNRGRR